MSAHPIVFAGDPHRNFARLLRACAALPPGTLVLLGDCECDAPLPDLLAPVLAVGWELRWILGNRDTDSERTYDNLVGAHPGGDIGGVVVEVGGVRIAGLSGVFKPRVWHPVECAQPRFLTRAEFLRALPAAEHWRGGLPLWHRDTIFPEDFERLRRARFDVLVTHEAPSSHRHGFTVIDELAGQGGARWIVHGHHHQSYAATLPNGIRVRGLGLAECWSGIAAEGD
ncbi:MAG TPA: metallophosphoesterase [Acetobacteraceae bacterium]|nr:metallophosphoesterase [Acetobacteraceae bacterium]